MRTIVLQRIGNSFMATLPRWVVNSLKWGRGDTLTVDTENGAVIIRAIVRAPVGKTAIKSELAKDAADLETGTL